MNILFTGKGSSGSWQIRGVQLGGDIGIVQPQASVKQCQAADAIVVVKRINHPFFNAVKASGTPWVWDLVDFFPQPECGKWSRDKAIAWVRKQITKAAPMGVIYPCQRMADDIGLPGAVIYHHARPAPANPVRRFITRVGYEGSPKFLGRWRSVLQQECARRGWQFVEGAPLHEVDVVVAFRDGDHNGYAQSHWKSNVKLANAHGTGTPFVGQRDIAYQETASGAERWVNAPQHLAQAFDSIAPYGVRLAINEQFLASTITLHSRAEQLRRYVEQAVGNG